VQLKIGKCKENIIKKRHTRKNIYFLFFAVITGSSRGIGKSYAIELAKRGMNIVLISKGSEALFKVSKEIGYFFLNYLVRTLNFLAL